LIDADGTPTPFQPDPWQEADFEALDGAWLSLTGRPGAVAPTIRRAWLERPRGHSKTADLAVPVVWALAFATRPLSGVAAAADRDQARLLRDAIATLARLNRWLGQTLDVQSWRVVNTRTGSALEILSSDEASSYGQLPDFVIADEVTHWTKDGLWVSLFSAAAKRASCLFLASMNAGFTGSWVWQVREAVRTDPAWYFNHLDGPRASWITPARLAEQRRLLPPLAYDRLWGNEWTSGSGDALTEADILAAVRLEGPMLAREGPYSFFGGLDLGISRDHASLVLLARHERTKRLRLAQVYNWQPPRGGKIDLDWVKDKVLDLHRIFGATFYLDPYQAELLAQQLAKAGVRVELIPFVGKNLNEMASNLIEAFADRNIDLYPHAALLDDLKRLRIKETAAGWKLDPARTQAGHGDRATGLSLALLAAKREPGRRSLGDWLNLWDRVDAQSGDRPGMWQPWTGRTPRPGEKI
jgi:hypothetical protein